MLIISYFWNIDQRNSTFHFLLQIWLLINLRAATCHQRHINKFINSYDENKQIGLNVGIFQIWMPQILNLTENIVGVVAFDCRALVKIHMWNNPCSAGKLNMHQVDREFRSKANRKSTKFSQPGSFYHTVAFFCPYMQYRSGHHNYVAWCRGWYSCLSPSKPCDIYIISRHEVTRKPRLAECLLYLPSASGDITRHGSRVTEGLILWYVTLEAMWYMLCGIFK